MNTTKKGPTAGTVKGPDNQSELFYQNPADLSSQAAEINRLHSEAQRHAKAAIDTAIEIGQRLAAVKQSLAHGQWIPWVEENLPFDRRQASNYMRAYNERELLNGNPASHLKEAINILSTPKSKAPILTIDPEFSSILPPLRDCEYRQLENNLLADGCRCPLVIWRGILLDGHVRYELCRKHNIAFETVEVNLPDREAAIEWIVNNQCGRGNLTQEKLHSVLTRMKERKPLQAEIVDAEDINVSTPDTSDLDNLDESEEEEEQGDERKERSRPADLQKIGKEIESFCNAIGRLSMQCLNLQVTLKGIPKDRRSGVAGFYEPHKISGLNAEIEKLEKIFCYKDKQGGLQQ